MSMDCPRSDAVVAMFLDADHHDAAVGSQVAVELADHLESCPRCAQVLAKQRRIDAVLASRTSTEIEEGVADRLLGFLKESSGGGRVVEFSETDPQTSRSQSVGVSHDRRNRLLRVAASLVATGASYFSFASTGPHERLITPSPVAVGTLDSTVWKTGPEITTEALTVTGMLEAVDLRANRFRIRDDIGNDIRLDDVADLEAAARLIGTRVVATGTAERDDRNRVRLVEPVVGAEKMPSQWVEMPIAGGGTGGRIPERAVADVSDEEIEAFLAEIRS